MPAAAASSTPPRKPTEASVLYALRVANLPVQQIRRSKRGIIVPSQMSDGSVLLTVVPPHQAAEQASRSTVDQVANALAERGFRARPTNDHTAVVVRS